MDWPKYRSHKVVRAMPIVEILPGCVLVGESREEFRPTVEDMVELAEVGGYAVAYDDGFKSISPKKAFEDGYTRIET
jgi:hypothetical protein